MKIEDIFSNSTFFLGAGAVAESGCLTSGQMLRNLQEKIRKEEDDLNQEAYFYITSCLTYQNTWKNLKNNQDDDYNLNIEDFIFIIRKIINRDYYLPNPLVGNWSEKIIKLESKDELIFTKLLNKISNVYLPQWLTIDKDKQKKLLDPIMNFFTETSDLNFNLDIFTLNYDLVLESFFNTDKINLINDGFTGKQWADGFDLKESTESNKYRINLYKLHGSMNWERDGELDQVVKTDHYSNANDPLIIFGQEAKMLSVDPFLSLTSRFKRKLEDSDFYFVIGYSFFDTYINNLLLEGVNRFPERKMIVVNSSCKDSKKLSEKIARIQKNDFNGAYNISSISPDKIVLVNEKAGNFYDKYLGEKGKELKKLIDKIGYSDEPF